jgi:hypothetical protein
MDIDDFSRDGFVLLPGVLVPEQCASFAVKIEASKRVAGARHLLSQDWCVALANQLRHDTRLAALVPADHVAVQCSYFEKSAECNWLVSLHQDLSIPVARKVETPALRGWSEKDGELYVQPPTEVLAQLTAVRLHLDHCGHDDGPLRLVPGSHSDGRLPSGATDGGQSVEVTAAAGDALVMRPLLLHASSKSSGFSRRRVLHFVFGPPALPHGLVWRHALSAPMGVGII